MRYRLYYEGRVFGPWETEEIFRQEWFDPELLVCPETKSGISASDWRRARDMADFLPAVPSAKISPFSEIKTPDSGPPSGRAPINNAQKTQESGRAMPQEITDLKESIGSFENAVRAMLENQQHTDARFRDEIAQIKKSMENTLTGFQNEISGQKSEIQKLADFKNSAETVLKEIRDSLAGQASEIQKAAGLIAEAGGRLSELDRRAAGIEESLTSLKQLQDNIGAVEEKIGALEEKIVTLEAEGMNQAVSAAQQQKEEILKILKEEIRTEQAAAVRQLQEREMLQPREAGETAKQEDVKTAAAVSPLPEEIKSQTPEPIMPPDDTPRTPQPPTVRSAVTLDIPSAAPAKTKPPRRKNAFLRFVAAAAFMAAAALAALWLYSGKKRPSAVIIEPAPASNALVREQFFKQPETKTQANAPIFNEEIEPAPEIKNAEKPTKAKTLATAKTKKPAQKKTAKKPPAKKGAEPKKNDLERLKMTLPGFSVPQSQSPAKTEPDQDSSPTKPDEVIITPPPSSEPEEKEKTENKETFPSFSH
ncbi:MAG: hypothetical protein HY747_04090 [Elusimicrobia bacterium]|nr:hypothetical protein [Elusimicrobiota bacterium]